MRNAARKEHQKHLRNERRSSPRHERRLGNFTARSFRCIVKTAKSKRRERHTRSRLVFSRFNFAHAVLLHWGVNLHSRMRKPLTQRYSLRLAYSAIKAASAMPSCSSPLQRSVRLRLTLGNMLRQTSIDCILSELSPNSFFHRCGNIS